MDLSSEIIDNSSSSSSVGESNEAGKKFGPARDIPSVETSTSSCDGLEKPKATAKKKQFILDNMLPTLEASLNETPEKAGGEAANDEEIIQRSLAPVPASEGEGQESNEICKVEPCSSNTSGFIVSNTETGESPETEACVSDGSFPVSNVSVVKEEITEDSNSQDHIVNPHESVRKKKESKKSKTKSLASYKNKEMSAEDLEACNVGSDDKPYVCPVCQSCFKQAFPLKRHMMIHSAVKPFFCTVCDFRCNDGSNLRKHMQTHDDSKKLKCPDCDYTCGRPDHLRNHRAKHTGVYKYVCGICGYACNQACDLTRHMIVHGGGKFFTCDQCDYSTNRRSYLRLHMEKHINASALLCSICSFQASTPVGLRNHLLVHSKEKSFQCSDCGQLTTSKSSLIRHRLVHKKDDAKRYQCRHCEFSCHWRSDLVKHLRRKHYFSDINAIYVEVEAADQQVRVKQEAEEPTHQDIELS